MGLVVQVHAFAEEMNKSRRMAAIQARALAAAGLAVLQIDLLGCGDSDGDFGEATWSQWCNDVIAASQWLLKRHAHTSPRAPLWLWGHRAGALIAVDAACVLDRDCNFLFWQPAIAGRSTLQQFLRLGTIGDWSKGEAPAATASLRGRLAAGEQVEIAGYALAPELALGLERARLTPSTRSGSVAWLEMSSRPDPELTPASIAAIAEWRQAGHVVRAQVVQGPPFWQTTEIEDAPALIAATVAICVAMSNTNTHPVVAIDRATR